MLCSFCLSLCLMMHLCWQHADRDGMGFWWILPHGGTMQKLCPNYKCGAGSPPTLDVADCGRHVKNSSVTSTVIHHHLSSISQCETTPSLCPDPLWFIGNFIQIAFCHFLRSQAQRAELIPAHLLLKARRPCVPLEADVTQSLSLTHD